MEKEYEHRLGPGRLDQVFHAALALEYVGRTRRQLLFYGIPKERRFAIPEGENPLEQLRLDIAALNAMNTVLGPEFHPMRIWLENALRHAGARVEHRIFAEAIRYMESAWPSEPAPSVLIVEDDLPLAGHLVAALEEAACTVRTTDQIHDAIDLIDMFSESLRVIALDLSLPDRGGRGRPLEGGPTVAAYVRQHYPGIRLLGMTQFANRAQVEVLLPHLDRFLEKAQFVREPTVFVDAINDLLSTP